MRFRGALYSVLVKIYEHKLVVWQLHRFVPPFDANNVGTWCIKGLYQTSRKHWYINACPRQRVEQLDKGLAREVEHRCVGRKEDDAGFCKCKLEIGSVGVPSLG